MSSSSPLIQKKGLKKKKPEVQSKLTYAIAPKLPRTCFICSMLYSDIIPALSRTIEDKTYSIRVCPSCHASLTKFTPLKVNLSAPISHITEGRVIYTEDSLMRKTKKDIIGIMKEHGLV